MKPQHQRTLLNPEEIRDLRVALRLNQAEFPRIIGLRPSPSTTSRWETGNVTPSYYAMNALVARWHAYVEEHGDVPPKSSILGLLGLTRGER